MKVSSERRPAANVCVRKPFRKDLIKKGTCLSDDFLHKTPKQELCKNDFSAALASLRCLFISLSSILSQQAKRRQERVFEKKDVVKCVYSLFYSAPGMSGSCNFSHVVSVFCMRASGKGSCLEAIAAAGFLALIFPCLLACCFCSGESTRNTLLAASFLAVLAARPVLMTIHLFVFRFVRARGRMKARGLNESCNREAEKARLRETFLSSSVKPFCGERAAAGIERELEDGSCNAGTFLGNVKNFLIFYLKIVQNVSFLIIIKHVEPKEGLMDQQQLFV